ncbi:hypothetical protein SAMN05421856_102279 [Chryseobacterium taichungense]|uniref:Uncharacterized protein n=1 Tax=Chryseobacterium taichungense TaxID=295069 RepID=A0A1H7XAA5_9FLAO|nr:hypothetical protein SAMN05421856_102279 [Chryseobacterium taichungense]
MLKNLTLRSKLLMIRPKRIIKRPKLFRMRLKLNDWAVHYGIKKKRDCPTFRTASNKILHW